MFRAVHSFLPGIALCIGLYFSPFGLSLAAPNSSVPLKIVNGTILVASLQINAQGPFEFVIDTGTNTTLLDPDLVNRLALTPVDRISLATLSGSTSVPRFFLDAVAIGEVVARHVEVLREPLPALRQLDPHIRGILGLNVLKEFSFLIDYKEKRFAVYPSGDSSSLPSGVRVPVRIVDDSILVPVKSEDAPGKIWNLALDSGVSEVFVFDDRLRHSGFTNGQSMLVTTNLSEREALTSLLSQLDIGKIRLRGLTVVAMPVGGRPPGSSEDGLLPASLFRSVFFDCSSSTLILVPR